MERAGRSLAKLRLSDTISNEELAAAAWPAAVGKRLAMRTRAVALVRGRLVVEVEDATWQKQLRQLSRHILSNLEKTLGETAKVTDIEFRVTPARRPPQTAATPSGDASSQDEADAISDPVLRRIYRQARKRANA